MFILCLNCGPGALPAMTTEPAHLRDAESMLSRVSDAECTDAPIACYMRMPSAPPQGDSGEGQIAACIASHYLGFVAFPSLLT